jgi:2-polyprenyl-3-methyl-5-hydroxy-6-metoxy-1,4-benzoquinol methylase
LNAKKNEFLNSKIDFFDMNKLENLDFKPDIIIFGEVIEHLMNLEIALTNLKKVMSKDTLLIISTPNAYHVLHQINAML